MGEGGDHVPPTSWPAQVEDRPLAARQRLIVAAAVLADMLEFYDYFLMGFVLAFIVGPWHLTFGQSATLLLTSGVGAIAGAFAWGALADAVGRRPIFIATLITFSLATGVMALTPRGAWVFMAVFRFFVGFGVGGLYSVDLPLVQEFVPAARRGLIGGIITAFIPVGILLGSLLAATASHAVGWRGLFLIGLVPALLSLLVRAWVPESPRWLLRRGREAEARRSLAWALQLPLEAVALPAGGAGAPARPWTDLFRYPRSLALSWLGNLGMQTSVYGLTLWGPTLLVLLLGIKPPQAAYLFIFVSLGGLAGRISFSFLSEAVGRRASGGLLGFGAAFFLLLAGLLHSVFLGGVSLFWLLLIATQFFNDGGFAVVGPYAAEVWPTDLRASGMGSAYGFGGFGKILGPLGLALIAGSSNFVTPAATVARLTPAFAYLAGFAALAGVVYLALGIETRGRPLEEIDAGFDAAAAGPTAIAGKRG
jgi:putative MFS transporter